MKLTFALLFDRKIIQSKGDIQHAMSTLNNWFVL